MFRFHALVTTYEVIIQDVELLSQIEWRISIIDEAHRLKNQKCKLSEGLKLLDLEHRVLLTGTPLQNNVEELFSLLHFLEPKQFNSSESFLADFGDLKSESQVNKLKEVRQLWGLPGSVSRPWVGKIEATLAENFIMGRYNRKC